MNNPVLCSDDFQKLPPQAVDLEEVVLATIITNRRALLQVIDIAKPEIFYKESHQKICRAIHVLTNNNSPVDLITVMIQLKSTGDLESVGGPYALAKITNKASGIENIEYHTRILIEKHLTREVISLASQLQKEGFEYNVDVFELLNKTQDKILTLVKDALHRDFVGFSEALTETAEDIQEANLKAGKLNGIPSGFTALDSMTGGFQPTDLIILAARPAMGKTAFALNVAKNMAQKFGKKVAFFSLEMATKQLITRIISSEAKIPSDRLRRGDISEEEWVLFNTALRTLSGINIYVDDTAAISIFELKAKVMRLKEQKDVDCVFVDYLQLMTAGSNKQNREQEISTISRGLKALAKEVGVPVIALSQLSRDVEKRGGSKRPVLSDLRECLSTNTSYIYGSNSISKNNTKVNKVLSLNGDYLTTLGSLNIPKTKNHVYRITTKTGRFIDATLNHLVLTTDGYKYVKNLTLLDSLILAKNFQTDGIFYPESRLIGHMIGNGCMMGKNTPGFITNDKDVSDCFCQYIYKKFGFYPRQHKHYKSDVFQWDISKHNKRTKEGNPFKLWLVSKKLWGKKAHEKQIPEWFIETADTRSIIDLMAGLIETDGSVYTVKEKQTVSYSTTSYVLAQQIMYLFAKIGIIANIDNGYLSKKANYPIYKITINDSHYLKIFRNNIKLIGIKGRKLKSFDLNRRTSYISNKAGHNTSVAISKLITNGRLQVHGNRGATQNTLRKLSLNNDLGEYRWLISDNIHLDPIRSIEYHDEVDVFDRAVPCTNNFIVNGIVTHNSGAIEQDADIVMFLYRPEYYGIENTEDGSSTKGIASLIVAKHRNGSIGDVNLKFRSVYTQFSDPDPNYGFTIEAQTIPPNEKFDDDMPF